MKIQPAVEEYERRQEQLLENLKEHFYEPVTNTVRGEITSDLPPKGKNQKNKSVTKNSEKIKNNHE